MEPEELRKNSEQAFEDVRARLAEKIAGEVTLSENPGETLKKWRTNFDVPQSELSNMLEVSASVISDYESGRRKSPGTNLVSRVVDALMKLDDERGGDKIRAYENILREEDHIMGVLYDIYEYSSPIPLQEFCQLIQAENITPIPDKPINGYTIIDSLKAIIELSSNEFHKIYGWSTERALIFSKVSRGRSPMVAIRVTSLKPGVVVMQGLNSDDVDSLAVRIAEIERVPLITTSMSVEELTSVLRR